MPNQFAVNTKSLAYLYPTFCRIAFIALSESGNANDFSLGNHISAQQITFHWEIISRNEQSERLEEMRERERGERTTEERQKEEGE